MTTFLFEVIRGAAFHKTLQLSIPGMSKTEVILISNVVGLGAESDHVKVAAGYARNYLFPQGLAVPLTAANKRRLEALRQRRAEREAHELNTMTELARSLQKVVLVLTAKTGDDGKMFGAITPGAIADEMKHQLDVAIDKKKIHLEHPLRTLGEHEVEFRLHQDVTVKLKVRVESSTPVAPQAEAPATEAREGARGRFAAREGRPRPVAKESGKERPAAVARAEPRKERKPRAEKKEKAG